MDMRKFYIPAFAVIFLALSFTGGCARNTNAPTVGPGPDISIEYLRQARAYRADGRYDLARQAYTQALSTCRSNANLDIIKRELAGTELLIRTMR